MAENLLQALTDIRQRLENQEYKNEEHVRFSLVGRVLLALGWNIWNPNEVITEDKPHDDDHTKVDITLRAWGPKIPKVYIECKRVGLLLPFLGKVETQMMDYNKNNKADLILLTDGQHWRFYYAPGSAAFRDRLFDDYDLLNHHPEQVSQAFEELLSKAAVVSGKAQEIAEGRWERQQIYSELHKLLESAKVSSHQNKRLLQQELVYQMHTRNNYPINEDIAISFLESVGFFAAGKPQPPIVKAQLLKTAAKLDNGPQLLVTPDATILFRLKGRGADAKAEYLPDGKMRVAEGALAAGTVTKSMPPAKKIMRDHLMQTGVLVPHENTLRFACEHTFRSPSEAAEVIYGNSINAREAWLHETTKEPIGKFMPKKSP